MHSSRNLSTYLSVHPSASSCDSRAGTILSCPQVSPRDELKELWAQNNSVFTSAFETEPDWVFLVGHPSILTEFQPISGCCWLLSPFTVLLFITEPEIHMKEKHSEQKSFLVFGLICLSISPPFSSLGCMSVPVKNQLPIQLAIALSESRVLLNTCEILCASDQAWGGRVARMPGSS